MVVDSPPAAQGGQHAKDNPTALMSLSLHHLRSSTYEACAAELRILHSSAVRSLPRSAHAQHLQRRCQQQPWRPPDLHRGCTANNTLLPPIDAAATHINAVRARQRDQPRRAACADTAGVSVQPLLVVILRAAAAAARFADSKHAAQADMCGAREVGGAGKWRA